MPPVSKSYLGFALQNMAIALSPFVNVPDFGTVMSCLISPKFMPGGGESPVGSGNRLS